MNTEYLGVFVECVRKRSFAAVARDRDVDPATISRTVAAIESEIGIRLFQRSTRKIELTEAGAIYFERIEPLVEELRKAQFLARETVDTPQGVLRISSPVSFAEHNITPLLPEFSALYPELRFELIWTDTILDPIGENIDAAIRVGPLPDSSLIATRLCPMIARVCASPAYVEKFGMPEKPEDLATHRCLLLAMEGFARNRWTFTDPGGKKTVVQVGEFLRTSNAMALKQCALAGMGVIILGRWIVGKELADGKLIDLFPDFETTASTENAAAWLLYPSRRFVPQKVRLFADFLKEKFRNGAPWDQIAA